MPLGIRQGNNFTYTTLDIWHDKVFYQEREFPAGFFGTAILNISEEEMKELIQKGGAPTFPLPTVIQGTNSEAARAFPLLREQIISLAELLWRYPPFCYNDQKTEREWIDKLFADSALPIIRVPGSQAQREFLMYCAAITRIPVAILHYTTAARFFELDYLRRLKKRKEDSFAVAAHDCFNSETFWKELRELQGWDMESFSVRPHLESTYVLARSPKSEKEMVFVERVTFLQVVDFYTYDLLHGLHHGHAPSQCLNCGKFFLTVNGHKPKYCNGSDPERPELSCREKGALLHLSESNEEHPIYQLFRTRANTIRKHEERGKITHAVRVAAIRQAEIYRDKALLDKAYAKEQYKEDMKTDHLYAVVRQKK